MRDRIFTTVGMLFLAACVIMLMGFLYVNLAELKEDAQQTQLLLDETIDRLIALQEEAVEAYSAGYDVYFEGFLLNPEEVDIEWLLRDNVVVFVDHDERFIVLKD